MDLTISIVSHNNRELLRGCLESIYSSGAALGLEFETVVVINVPGDGSADMVRSKYPAARVMENKAPLGFAANHNNALRGARGRHIALLNDDTVAAPGCFAALVKFLDAHPDAGVAGPRTLNKDGTLQQSCYRRPTLSVLFYDALFISSIFARSPVFGGYKRWAHDTVREVGYVIGACMIIPGEIFERVGPLDERFFLYFEEADFCERARAAGYRVYFVPDASITHHGGASISRLGPAEIDHFHSSMDLYYQKHFGRAAVAAVHALNVLGASMRLAIFSLASPFSPAFRNKTAAQRDRYRQVLAWYLKKGPRL